MYDLKVTTKANYVIRGEINSLICSLRRGLPHQRWNSNPTDQRSDPLVKKLQTLKDALDTEQSGQEANKLSFDANFFLVPFLDVIRSEDTSGPVTSLALSSVEKFISTGILNEKNGSGGAAEAITDAVIHAHFVSTDSASDEIVLLKILQVLHTLFASPLGVMLSNESVCELMQSCFRMCFVEKANELLRKSAETALVDMIRILFTRLRCWPQNYGCKYKSRDSQNSVDSTVEGQVGSPDHSIGSEDPEVKASSPCSNSEAFPDPKDPSDPPNIVIEEPTPESSKVTERTNEKIQFRNMRGIRFTNFSESDEILDRIVIPHGIPCVRELLRFLISLISPHEKQNTELMIHLGLKLLLVSVETGIDAITSHSYLSGLMKNELLKNLLALLNVTGGGMGTYHNFSTSTTPLLLSIMRILFIVFEKMRFELKYQLEVAILKFHEIIGDLEASVSNSSSSTNLSSLSNQSRWSLEQKEIVLEYLIQLWNIPCFVTELYLNYDCDLFCSNVFEDTVKMLSKNSIPNANSGIALNMSCVDGLSCLLSGIENHCTQRMTAPGPPNASVANSSSGSDDSSNSVFYNENSPSLNFIIREDADSSISDNLYLPTHEDLMAIRHKKKIFHTGCEHFNSDAKKGVEFLRKNSILKDPLEPQEIATFLRDNPLLDKQAIGDYVSSKKNSQVLSAFVKSFDFKRLRIDEALRIFLETFRLPGEAPLISHILEEFADHWTSSNGNPFANVDAAFTLSYAIIMLNVDQHNTNVKKQGNSMKWEDFRKNLKGVNGGSDFPEDMLKEIFDSIKNTEIVMPAEHTGTVKENYIWKVLLRRSELDKKPYFKTTSDEGAYDHDLFSLSWGSVLSALCCIFDKSSNSASEPMLFKTFVGFKKCATIASYYGMSDVLDHLLVSLCKFSATSNSLNAGTSTQELASNQKSQQACRMVFKIVHRYGSILREGWRNFVVCLVYLFQAQYLPRILTESEDFIDPSGRVSLIRKNKVATTPRAETGLFSSLYSYIALSSSASVTDSPGGGSGTKGDESDSQKIQSLIKECQPELLLSETKFLPIESLIELVKSLIQASPVPEANNKREKKESSYEEDVVVFVMEILIKIVIQNRDRVLMFWEPFKDHIYSLIFASASRAEYSYLLERSVVGLLRVALRLMRREDLCSNILQSLSILLYLKPACIIKLSQQMSFGLHEILKTTAANIHKTEDWTVIFAILEYIGAGKIPDALIAATANVPPASIDQNVEPERPESRKSLKAFQFQNSLSREPVGGSQSNLGASASPIGWSSSEDRGYTSDSELEVIKPGASTANNNGASTHSQNVSPAQSWILLTTNEDSHSNENKPSTTSQPKQDNLQRQQLERQLCFSDPTSLVKSSETLSFLVRDAAHITPDNFTLCVNAIRSFVDASTTKYKRENDATSLKKRHKNKANRSEYIKSKSFSGSSNLASNAYDADYDSDPEIERSITYQQVSIQLLDLLHTLHTRASQIFQWWEQEQGDRFLDAVRSQKEAGQVRPSIWTMGWKPILQAICVLCHDSRKQVRTAALTYLQRALLVHDLQQLNPQEWQSCFMDVLFPLMVELLQTFNSSDPNGMEETRVRGSTLLCKVFLQHLSPLLRLGEDFTPMWLEILNFMERYLRCTDTKNELLAESVPESLKNLLLVMDTAGVFHTADGYTKLWALTWDKIDLFLPGLRAEVMRTTVPTVNPVSPKSPEHVQKTETVTNSPFMKPVNTLTAGDNPVMIPPATSPLLTSPLFMPNSSQMSSFPVIVPHTNLTLNEPVPPPRASDCNTEQTRQNPNIPEPGPPHAGMTITPEFSSSPRSEYTAIMLDHEDVAPNETPIPTVSGASAE